MKKERKHKLVLYKPQVEDLWFRKQLLEDEATMSFNHSYGGIIPFPQTKWESWYEHWIINHEDKRFYRYLKDEDAGLFIGETAYHFDEERKIWLADIIIYHPYRHQGYGKVGLNLLINATVRNGITIIYDDLANDNPALKLFLEAGFTEDYRTDDYIMMKKVLIPENNITIKKLEAEQIKEALKLALMVFDEFEAPDYSKEGIEEFHRSLNSNAFINRLTFYGAFISEKLCGIIATRDENSHIALFFVDKEYQHCGIGRKLFETVLADCKESVITVNSSPYAVKIYEKLGFIQTSDEKSINGIRFTPMEYKLSDK